MNIEVGKTYRGGTTLQADSKKRVLVIEGRYSGTYFVKWVNVKKDGKDGATGWTRMSQFKEWAREEIPET